MARSSLSPFGVLLAEIRDERKHAGPERVAGAGEPASRPRPGPEPDLRIETRVVSGPQRLTPSLGRALWPASLLLHAGLIVLLVVVPLLRSEALPAPVREARVFFVAPASLSMPLPPPPPPPASSRAGAPPSVRRPAVPPTPALTAPVEVPEPAVVAADRGLAVLEDDGRAPREAGGVPGGVAGGVPGGVVGGVLGGVAAAPAPVVPVRVGGEIREPRKIRDVSPVYPALAVAAHVRGSVVLECLVSPQGLVTDVRLMRGIPLLNAPAMDAVRQWMYTPTLKDGVPVPVLLTVTVRFDL